MREIKFRGKNDKGNWVYGYPIIVLHKAWIKDISDTTTNPRRLGRDFADFRCVEVEKETVGQYTGLKDKNGKEIYEGDIIACGDGKVSTEIKWVQKSSAFMGYNIMRDEYHLLNEYFKRFIGEIIGNIHEEV